MVLDMKEMRVEYLAAGIRQQIQALRMVNEEMENENLNGDALAWRIRAVELQLRRIREAA